MDLGDITGFLGTVALIVVSPLIIAFVSALIPEKYTNKAREMGQSLKGTLDRAVSDDKPDVSKSHK
ncbi:MAG: hypothetical protein LBP36_01815 [Oscillospiraceae bacterium]|nr:hypothetical protein [Oscillospiraceae bacterium]